MAVPFMNQIAVLPLVSRHNKSLMPSPLWSPTSAIDHVVGTLPSPPADNTAAPFSQMDVSPTLSRQTMSVLPSPSKSPMTTDQLNAHQRPYGPTRGGGQAGGIGGSASGASRVGSAFRSCRNLG
jgi:hypothetical protein